MHKCICCQDDLVSFIHLLPKKSQHTNHPFSHFFQVWVRWVISTQSYCNALTYRRRDSCWKTGTHSPDSQSTAHYVISLNPSMSSLQSFLLTQGQEREQYSIVDIVDWHSISTPPFLWSIQYFFSKLLVAIHQSVMKSTQGVKIDIS